MATQDVDLESSHECVAILNIKDLGLDNFIAAYTIINTKVSLSFWYVCTAEARAKPRLMTSNGIN